MQSVNQFGKSLHISLSNSVVNHTGRISKPRCFEPHWMREEECYDFFDKLWIPDSNPSVIHQSWFYTESSNGMEQEKIW